MKCPACENELTLNKGSGVHISVCQGSCGGLWFPYSQIKKIERVKPGMGSILLHFDKAEGVRIYRDAEHPCPQCETTLLYRHFFSRKLDTEVNQCSKCSGFWIDAGGLIDRINSKGENKKVILEDYRDSIINKKISGMNLSNPDIAEAAEILRNIFIFLIPKH